MNTTKKGRILGVDYGDVRTGLAVSDALGFLASGIGTIRPGGMRNTAVAVAEEAKKQNTSKFTIPFNRQQLADFLSVDRSAMSNELGKMRDDGLLIFDKNKFTLL